MTAADTLVATHHQVIYCPSRKFVTVVGVGKPDGWFSCVLGEELAALNVGHMVDFFIESGGTAQAIGPDVTTGTLILEATIHARELQAEQDEAPGN